MTVYWNLRSRAGKVIRINLNLGLYAQILTIFNLFAAKKGDASVPIAPPGYDPIYIVILYFLCHAVLHKAVNCHDMSPCWMPSQIHTGTRTPPKHRSI